MFGRINQNEAIWMRSVSVKFCSVTQSCLTLCNSFQSPWTAACQAFLSIINTWSKLLSIELVMPSNHLILCHPLILLPSIFPSNRVFSSESVLHIRWPRYWSFSLASVFPMNIQSWFPLGWTRCSGFPYFLQFKSEVHVLSHSQLLVLFLMTA